MTNESDRFFSFSRKTLTTFGLLVMVFGYINTGDPTKNGALIVGGALMVSASLLAMAICRRS